MISISRNTAYFTTMQYRKMCLCIDVDGHCTFSPLLLPTESIHVGLRVSKEISSSCDLFMALAVVVMASVARLQPPTKKNELIVYIILNQVSN